ncbi:MAG: hypothetical protein LBI33_06740 [Propionibacteriaceae bacterium]|nr:hypothetical protein [Propionibacteriaceae bacterium]
MSAQIHSSPVDLVPQVANAAGVVSFAWSAPAGFAAGTHEIRLTGSASTVTTTFTVAADGVTAPTGGIAVPGPVQPLVLLLVLTVGVIGAGSRSLRQRPNC